MNLILHIVKDLADNRIIKGPYASEHQAQYEAESSGRETVIESYAVKADLVAAIGVHRQRRFLVMDAAAPETGEG